MMKKGGSIRKTRRPPVGQMGYHTMVTFTERAFLGEADISMPGVGNDETFKLII